MENLWNKQNDNTQFHMFKNIQNVVRNVSSIELDKLLHENNSTTFSTSKYRCMNSGDCLQLYSHMFDRGRIIIQRCQNKGCMCKPIINAKPKYQVDNEVQTSSDTDLEPTVESKAVEVNDSETSNLSRRQSSQEDISEMQTPISESTTSQEKTSTNESEIRMSQTVVSDNAKKLVNTEVESSEQKNKANDSENNKNEFKLRNNRKLTKFVDIDKENFSNLSPSEMKFCVPSNFEQLLRQYKEIDFVHCQNQDHCVCDKYNIEDGFKKGIKLPGKNICMQISELPEVVDKTKLEQKKTTIEELKEEVKPKEERTPKQKIEQKSRKSKKERQVKEPKKKKKELQFVDSASSTSKKTCFCFKKKTPKKGSEKSIQTCKCCSNKTCQKETSNNICFSTTDKIRNIECSGEAINDKVKSIWICSKCGKIYNNFCKKCDRPSCTKNTIILPSTPGVVLPNDQSETLRTLIKLEAKQNYRQIDNILHELNEQKHEIKKLYDMYQCISNVTKPKKHVKLLDVENYGLEDTQNVYFCEGCEINPNRNLVKTIMSRPEKKRNEDVFSNEHLEDSRENSENNKHLKNIMNKNKRIPEKEIETADFNNENIQPKNNEHNLSLKQNISVELNDKPRKNKKVKMDKLDHLMKDEMESEKPPVEKFSKADLTEPNACSFIGCWKKSLASLNQKLSKDNVKNGCQTLQNKAAQCKNSLTGLNKKESEEECSIQYFQDKIQKCKKSIAELQQKQNKNTDQCSYQFLQNKITQCKEGKTKKSIIGSCVNFFNGLKKK